ncbi:F0F1 ATP synthase subunit B [Massilibacteroides vaginae]|uniref:F0F1 ATP synthase subunit B n=1 Tax=Massilibacteroides vaginae TaxID=1673718 RepID=UPI000A1CF269|nr:F0F1 ATP synthase subunit B [Massilibacteroides vaginae]
MSLLTPDIGLLFWMILSFGIVFAILSKYGFPVIIKAIEQRKEYIDQSLEAARQANDQLAGIQAEGEKMLTQARERQNIILKEALAEKERIISEARQKASAETLLQQEEATRRIREEKDKAIREVRSEIADLSVAIAEKVMNEKISRTDEQEKIINGLLDKVSFSKS